MAYADDSVDLDWSAAVSGNGLATDKVVGVVVDIVNNVAFVNDSGVLRSATTIPVVVGTGRTVGNLRCYLAFYRGTGKNLIVSNSSYIIGS
jgi:hypothetical protein